MAIVRSDNQQQSVALLIERVSRNILTKKQSIHEALLVAVRGTASDGHHPAQLVYKALYAEIEILFGDIQKNAIPSADELTKRFDALASVIGQKSATAAYVARNEEQLKADTAIARFISQYASGNRFDVDAFFDNGLIKKNISDSKRRLFASIAHLFQSLALEYFYLIQLGKAVDKELAAYKKAASDYLEEPKKARVVDYRKISVAFDGVKTNIAKTLQEVSKDDSLFAAIESEIARKAKNRLDDAVNEYVTSTELFKRFDEILNTKLEQDIDRYQQEVAQFNERVTSGAVGDHAAISAQTQAFAIQHQALADRVRTWKDSKLRGVSKAKLAKKLAQDIQSQIQRLDHHDCLKRTILLTDIDLEKIEPVKRLHDHISEIQSLESSIEQELKYHARGYKAKDQLTADLTKNLGELRDKALSASRSALGMAKTNYVVQLSQREMASASAADLALKQSTSDAWKNAAQVVTQQCQVDQEGCEAELKVNDFTSYVTEDDVTREAARLVNDLQEGHLSQQIARLESDLGRTREELKTEQHAVIKKLGECQQVVLRQTAANQLQALYQQVEGYKTDARATFLSKKLGVAPVFQLPRTQRKANIDLGERQPLLAPADNKPGVFSRIGKWFDRHPVIKKAVIGAGIAFGVLTVAAVTIGIIAATGGAGLPVIASILAGVKAVVAAVGVTGAAALGAGVATGTVAVGAAAGGLAGAIQQTPVNHYAESNMPARQSVVSSTAKILQNSDGVSEPPRTPPVPVVGRPPKRNYSPISASASQQGLYRHAQQGIDSALSPSHDDTPNNRNGYSV